MKPVKDRTIALAGIYQACDQVQQLAKRGECDESQLTTAIRSILTLDAMTTSDVYGGIENLKSGLMWIAQSGLTRSEGDDLDVLRYLMTLLQINASLARDGERMQNMANDISKLNEFEESEIVSQCALVYQSHISIIKPQVIVQGDEDHLSKEEIPLRIRALLLAGIRSSVLWSQKDGSKFKLLWEKTKMARVAAELLSST